MAQCYVCRQSVIPKLEFGENKSFRFVCPCCSSATRYKEDVDEAEKDFCEGYVLNDEINLFNLKECVKKKIELYKSKGGG